MLSHDPGQDFPPIALRFRSLMGPTAELPDRETECALHQRLLAGDSSAPADVIAAFLNHLIRWITARNCGADDHLGIQAAEDALLELVKNPRVYDPGKKSLFGYLCMAASGDLKNALARERRHTSKTIPIESVEHSPGDGKNIGSEDDSLALVELRDEVKLAEPILAEVRDGLSEPELAALGLFLDCERKTEAYAEALGVREQPFDEQQDIVKRFKDRIANRIKRARRDHESP
jgi:hypothetical protein